MNVQELLTPENLHSIKGLSLLARATLEGYHSGRNRSQKIGQGMEFSQYRSYEPGDDLRLLDWKMVARSGKYFVRQSEIDTNITIKFIVDASVSMMHQDSGITKMDYARYLCATLGYLANSQGDKIGLYTLNEHQLNILEPQLSVQQFNRFLHQLAELDVEGKWPIKSNELEKLHDKRHKDLIIFVTDFHEHDEELQSFVKSIKTPRNEVVVLHLMGENERTLDYGKSVTLVDLETNKKLKVDRSRMLDDYQSALDAHLKGLKEAMLQQGIEYWLLNMGEPVHDAINMFLKRRVSMS